MKQQTEDPLIRISINWARWKHLLIAGFKFLVLAGRKIGEFILKTILRILILILRGTLATYKALRDFAKSRQRGFWILLLILAIIAGLLYARRVFAEKDSQYKELQHFHQIQLDETQKLMEENKELDEELKDTKEKLEAKMNTPVTVASARVTTIKPLPEEIKQIIATHADNYGVNRKYCECIISLESGGRPEAVGDNGAAVGVAQYHLGTYLADARRVGLPVKDDRTNPDTSIQAMTAALARGEDSKWTASRSCK